MLKNLQSIYSMFGFLNVKTSFSWRTYLRAPRNFFPLLLALLSNIFQWVMVFTEFPKGDGFLIIRYSIFTGANWLAPWYYILSLPLAGLAFLIVNFFVGYFIGSSSLLMRQVLLWIGLLLNLALSWLIFLLVIFNS